MAATATSQRGCVAVVASAVAVLVLTLGSAPSFAQDRPKVGVAFGGGSARGIAHVGVIRWFEEHHIPIDVAAGTSMGGLIGGAFATGMDAAALQAMLRGIDWDEMFGFSNFAFKNIRRKADARAYPSRLEFGGKQGLVLPPSLNDGQQVDLLITSITAPYFADPTFDTLPTPFRAVAVDLRTAQPVVLERGSLARAMRATMSLPGVFPPVQIDGQVLVDGGAMNNVPADIVRAMGARTVIAVNVGDLSDRETVNYSILGLAGATIDAMMRANAKRALTSADIVLNVPLEEFGSLDWRKSDALIEEGYRAAEAMKDTLLPLAVGDVEWRQWQEHRVSARKVSLPDPAFVTLDGVGVVDQRRMNELLAKHIGKPLDVVALEHDLEELSGLDRYQSITWSYGADATGAVGLTVRAIEKGYAPPFLMLGVNLENTTSDQFQLSITGRYLRFDVLGSGSELRLDAVVGADPGVGAALYRPLWRSVFAAPFAGVANRTLNLIEDEAIVARYSQTVTTAGAQLGINLGRESDLRLGATIGWLDAKATIGDPGLPSMAGKETAAGLTWRVDTQDSAVIPSRGTRAQAAFNYVFDGPNVTVDDEALATDRDSLHLPQLSGEATWFRELGERNRMFLLGGAGTSFDHHPLAVHQFPLGRPLHLGAYTVGEVRGDHYAIATAGYLRELGRMPDFLGGPIFVGAWLENGDAFDRWQDATVRTHVSSGIIMETLVGPVILAGSAGFDGRWRTYIGVGRLF
jgi:NTE family protein